MTYKQPYQKLINLPKIPSPFIFSLNDPGIDFRVFFFSLSTILCEFEFWISYSNNSSIEEQFYCLTSLISVSTKMSRNLIWKNIRKQSNIVGGPTNPPMAASEEKSRGLATWNCTGAPWWSIEMWWNHCILFTSSVWNGPSYMVIAGWFTILTVNTF